MLSQNIILFYEQYYKGKILLKKQSLGKLSDLPKIIQWVSDSQDLTPGFWGFPETVLFLAHRGIKALLILKA